MSEEEKSKKLLVTKTHLPSAVWKNSGFHRDSIEQKHVIYQYCFVSWQQH